ncbi:MAG: HEAT repeat domain-containing protein [Nitrospirae bacterium]|nr:HEAT repeat domain-containing protein [Nitrospirota bacterium]
MKIEGILMKIPVFSVCVIIFWNIISPVSGLAESRADLIPIKEKYYQKLISSDFSQRYEATRYFNQKLEKEDLTDDVIKESLNLLKNEAERIIKFRELSLKPGVQRIEEKVPHNLLYMNDEEFAVYYGDLCEIIGKSAKKDYLAILIEHCLEPKVFLYYGADAVDPIISTLLVSILPDKKMSAIFVLGEMLKPKKEGYITSGVDRSKIMAVLIQATSDSDRNIRQASVRAIGDSGDKDAVPVLTEIANNDPFYFEKTDRTTGKIITRYAVREEAKKALEKIREKDIAK